MNLSRKSLSIRRLLFCVPVFAALDFGLAQIKPGAGALDVFSPGQVICALAQFHDQFIAVFDMGDFTEGYRPPDAYVQAGSNASGGLAKDKGKPERQAQVARKLKQAAVLTGEENWDDGCL